MSLIQELYKINREIDALEDRKKKLRQEILDEYGEGTGADGRLLYKVSKNFRFDPKLAHKVLTQAELKKVSTLTPKAALVDELLPFKADQCRKENGFTVTVTENPDMTETVSVEL